MKPASEGHIKHTGTFAISGHLVNIQHYMKCDFEVHADKNLDRDHTEHCVYIFREFAIGNLCHFSSVTEAVQRDL